MAQAGNVTQGNGEALGHCEAEFGVDRGLGFAPGAALSRRRRGRAGGQ